ncbi:DUF1360 domain-containing protein [Nocardioides terrisoli]|uniref:DUF1360 domain-containing protein n=1 Tax=Nocardioides terrisoli TaxID=3388267 RepID=UPI00287B937F|nr:DUF1360 domain-containing protein [Nocardioides marmorisolisilvae]
MSDDNPHAPVRVASFAAALAVFGTTSIGVLLAARRKGMPDHYRTQDLLLGALATQKFTRLIAKDPVTVPIRAPFTDFEGVSGPAELAESPKPGHARHTVGELLSCPFCLAPWVAGAYETGLLFAPRVARAWAAVFSIVGASDALQQAYARLQED